MLLAAVVGVAFWLWLNRPGELLGPERLVGADTTGYAEWTLRLEDPGTEVFVTTLLDSIQHNSAAGGAPLPSFIDNWLREHKQKEQQEDIHRLFPLALGWTLRPGQEGSDLHLGTLSLERVGSRLLMLDWILGQTLGRSSRAELHEHLDERIYRLQLEGDRHVTFFLRGNDVFFTTDVDTARRAVDRLRESRTPAHEPGPADRLLAPLPSGRPLRAVLTNAHGEIARQLGHLLALAGAAPPDPELWGALDGLTLTAQLEPDGSLVGTLELASSGEAWSGAHAGELTSQLRRLDPESTHLHLESSARGDRVRVEFRVAEFASDLGKWIGKKLAVEARSVNVHVDP